jgi:hypothetical protein
MVSREEQEKPSHVDAGRLLAVGYLPLSGLAGAPELTLPPARAVGARQAATSSPGRAGGLQAA